MAELRDLDKGSSIYSLSRGFNRQLRRLELVLRDSAEGPTKKGTPEVSATSGVAGYFAGANFMFRTRTEHEIGSANNGQRIGREGNGTETS